MVLIEIVKKPVQSLRFFLPLGVVPGLLQQLRIGDGRVEARAQGLHSQVLPYVQVLHYVHNH